VAATLGAAGPEGGGVRVLAGWARESIRHYVGRPCDMANARGKFGDEGEVGLLAGGNRVRPPVEGANQRLVIGEHHEAAAF
jgi:hypothetical protein